MITYQVSSSQPQAHIFDITLSVSAPDPLGQVLALPNWSPGSYLIRDYARHIITIRALSENGDPVSIRKVDSNTWICDPIAGSLQVIYTVYAWDQSVRGARIDQTGAFFNGCCLFLQVLGQAETPCNVKISAPNCTGAQDWQIATSMQRVENTPAGAYGHYQAGNYDELIDHPIQLGNIILQKFNVAGITHTIAVTGKQDGDLARLAQDVAKICAVHLNLFNSPPFEEYLFLLQVVKDGYGGLEHRNSSALIIPRECLPLKGDPQVNKDYIRLLGLFSHEYFHAWNVKRIKPQSFLPYDLNRKNYTQQLWAFEGITAYYDELALVRAKVITVDQYFDLLAQTMTRLLRNSGREKQTVTQASFDAWIKFYQPNENSNNALVSYYVKGSLIALGVDLLLRKTSDGQLSLDDVMRQLWQQYGALNVGVPEGQVEALMAKLGGKEVAQFLQLALETTAELPLEPLLEEVLGLAQVKRVMQGTDDKGGKRPVPPLKNDTLFKPGTLGFSYQNNQGRIYVQQISPNSAALRAGLSALDEIVAMNGMRVDSDSFEKISKRLACGQKVEMHIFKQDILTVLTFPLEAPPLDTIEIVSHAQSTPSQKQLREKWLSD